MKDIGIITIGRNEGERLARCLASVVGRGSAVVYVDSGSTDDSVARARSLGAEVAELDKSLPFSAARARNAGFERLLRIEPDVRLVQFVDGDCEVASDWIAAARAALDSRADVAVVCGRRRERFPERSVYNRLADVEWDTPVGEAESCGGDALMRVDAFRAAGGYDASVVAGEEPELCQRLRDAGWKILRINAEMTLHDSAMLHFSQWWLRAVRSGYGACDVASRFGQGRDGLFVRHVQRTRLWTIAWPLAVVLAALLVGTEFGRVAGMAAALMMFGLLPLQMIRLAVRFRARTHDWKTAPAYGFLTMTGKWADLLGQIRYWRDRRAGRNTRLIDYKAPAISPAKAPTPAST